MGKLEYRVFTEDNMRYQNGERIDLETTPQWSLYEGPSLDDARAAMNEHKLDPCEVVPVHRGMDTVCYESVRLEVWEWNEDWDDWDYLMGCDEERLPDDYEEVIKAHDKQERQYWAWLDYQRDDYKRDDLYVNLYVGDFGRNYEFHKLSSGTKNTVIFHSGCSPYACK